MKRAGDRRVGCFDSFTGCATSFGSPQDPSQGHLGGSPETGLARRAQVAELVDALA